MGAGRWEGRLLTEVTVGESEFVKDVWETVTVEDTAMMTTESLRARECPKAKNRAGI